MSKEYYEAQLAAHSALPTLLCGRCNSILSKSRIFNNEGKDKQSVACHVIGLCSADDCGAVNCCDAAYRKLEAQDHSRQAAV
ncbi:hypothetical protein QQM79_07755 [Marinobacteraceae bacterium S3BR75-40.1]